MQNPYKTKKRKHTQLEKNSKNCVPEMTEIIDSTEQRKKLQAGFVK